MISETLGNKRLGDNVITGLERMLPKLVDFELEALVNSFPEVRLDSEGGKICEPEKKN
jgi:hypothetical protein